MGTINGHARPIVGGLGMFADHTNVSCTGVPGRLWVCCGVPPAGPIICTGVGSTNSADCLSKPATSLNLNDTTGILYGITGVCHQAANRVLFSANQAINNKCRGIRASLAMFGQFGIQTQILKARWAANGRFGAVLILNTLLKNGFVIDWITKVNTCVNINGDLPVCAPAPGGVPPPGVSLDPEEEKFINAIITMNKENLNWPEDDLYIETVLIMVTQGMHPKSKDELRIPVMKLLNDHLNKHATISADFMENKISTAQFVDQANKEILAAQKKLSLLLGAKQFKTGMSAIKGEFFQLVEPDLALENYGPKFSV
jgi:hypothetical protein